MGLAVSFTAWLVVGECFASELWGLREGLKLCCSLNIRCLEIEMDAKSIVEVLQNADYVNNAFSPIIDECRQLITQFHHVCIKHCFQQANQCADGLARMSCRMNAEFLIYDSPPVDILEIFEGDLNGMYFNRICPKPCIGV
ncbi:uncharacterized protein LOC126704150 [Quercus robur]|uniref:uncharacterized protein LOC126704150 n=1 Tax=Quercus robur TaxID=38942 RepID=UPI002162B2CC|nr:uncharacterized protein LOC126704150 [Quercus robur]